MVRAFIAGSIVLCLAAAPLEAKERSNTAMTLEHLSYAMGRLAAYYEGCGMNKKEELRRVLLNVVSPRLKASSVLLAMRKFDTDYELSGKSECHPEYIETTNGFVMRMLDELD